MAARRRRERARSSGRNRSPKRALKSNSTNSSLPPPGSPSNLSLRSFSARDRALHALAETRLLGVSLSRAARDNGVTVRTIKHYLGSALKQGRPGGRIRATKSDRFVRYLQFPTPEGPKEIAVRGSKDASELAQYLVSLKEFLRGDRTALAKFRGKKISGIELITDERLLIDLAEEEEFHIDSLYRSISGGAA